MTTAVSIRFVERFPEPAFAELQRVVFAPLEARSLELTAAVRAERLANKPANPPWPPMVRFGVYLDERLVGWTSGWFERPDSFYMANSGVVPRR